MFPETCDVAGEPVGGERVALGDLLGRRRGERPGLGFAQVGQRAHVVALRSGGGGRQRLAQEAGGVGASAEAEEQDAEIFGGVLMRGREQQRAPQSALGDAQLDDGPIVPKIGGLTSQQGAGKQGGGFADAARLKKSDGLGAGAAGIWIRERNGVFEWHGNRLRGFWAS